MTEPVTGDRVRVAVVGDAAVDVLVRPARAPVPGGDVPARIRTAPGGAGANTAAWLAHLDADPLLVARVGADPAGRAVAADLTAAGVRTALAVDPDLPTATVLVLLDAAGERTMLSDRGAAARLAPGDVPSLAGCRHLHLSGHVLLGPESRPAGLAALAAARAAGLTTSVDPQVAPPPARAAAFLADVAGVDLLLPSAAELAALGGADAALRVVGAVAVSCGAAGARWYGPGPVRTAGAPAVAVRDTTGAGDAFDAGLLAAWLRGAGPAGALAAGCAAGALAVTRAGARPPVSRR